MATAAAMHSATFNPYGYQAIVIIATTLTIAVYALYQYLLPKPIPGIPYNVEATKTLLGDIAAIQKESPENPTQWMIEKARRHGTPVHQFFITPLGRPCVLVADFREGQDILMRRKEFERSDFTISVLSGEAPQFHINLKTGPEWKAHRRLLQDLMTPKFLHTVAAPNIYKGAIRLLELWKLKSTIAKGLSYSAEQDIFYAALDAVYDFGFGDSVTHRALIPQVERLRKMTDEEAQKVLIRAGEQEALDFPVEKIHPATHAMLETAENVAGVVATGFPKLAWWLKGWRAEVKRMRAVRDEFLQDQALKAAERLQRENDTESEDHFQSAIDLMMQREQLFAKKEGREPVYWSNSMRDEIMGFVVAGHDTTSTTLCWGVKFITDSPSVQSRLRSVLRSAHADAFAEGRLPTHEEITRSNIPYLDAVVEEMLRLAHTALSQDRECTEDTVVLGHPIPKGTLVIVPNKGPSFTEPAYQINEHLRSKSCQNAAKEHGLRAWSELGMSEFRPERWLVQDEKTGNETFDAQSGPTIPFGLGLRGCFGRRLAYMELKLLTTLLVWTFEFQPCPEKLSGYGEIESLTRKPKQCFVNLDIIKD